MKISMDLLKELRATTFAPLKDCKNALEEAEWNLDKATALLKEKWILKAGKKSDRATNEWIVLFKKEWNNIAGIKLLCETDFVAKNEKFQKLVELLLDKVLRSGSKITSLDDIDSVLLEDLKLATAEFVGRMWENVQIWDVIADSGNIYVYNHPGNKAAAVIYYNGDDESIAKEVALQVTAMNPIYLSVDSVDSDYMNELTEKLRKEVLDSGKPEHMVDQILKWKISKSLSDIVLLEQDYIRDWSKKIKDILPEWFEVTKYIRITI